MTIAQCDFANDVGVTTSLRVTYTHSVTGACGTIDLSQPFVVIGRAAGCSLRLIDPSVAERHVYVQMLNGQPYVFVLGPRTGVCIGDQEVTEGWLTGGQLIKVGAFDLEVSGVPLTTDVPLLPTEERSADITPLAIAAVGDPTGLTHHSLPSPLTIVGRHPGCNFRVLDQRVRSFHAAIVIGSSAVWLVNLRSPERVRLNGRPVRWSRINVGDRIDLNGVQLEVRWNRLHTGATLDRLDPAFRKSDAVVLSPLAPLDGVGEIRQHVMMMTKLFAAFQEQIAIQQRQTELLQEIRDAVLNGQGTPFVRQVVDQPIPLQFTHTPPAPPTPKSTPADAVPTLSNAHNWLLAQLGKLGKTT